MLLTYMDITLKITEYLSDYDKIQLSKTCRKITIWKDKFTYCDKINIERIKTLPFFDKFEFIEISRWRTETLTYCVGIFNLTICPKCTKYLHYTNPHIIPHFETSEGRIVDVTHMTIYGTTKIKTVPQTVTHLIFCDTFNEPIYDIPEWITHLTFGSDFNEIISNIPIYVTHLTLGNNFNRTVHDLSLLITHLTFGDKFNQSIDHLPLFVTHLTFGASFNQPIHFRIPMHVTHLIFGDSFDQPINNGIFASVTHLTFGHQFNQPIKNNIPGCVTHLTFGSAFNQIIDDDILKSLQQIVVGINYFLPIKGATCIENIKKKDLRYKLIIF